MHAPNISDRNTFFAFIVNKANLVTLFPVQLFDDGRIDIYKDNFISANTENLTDERTSYLSGTEQY
jgi:hypothetical protein